MCNWAIVAVFWCWCKECIVSSAVQPSACLSPLLLWHATVEEIERNAVREIFQFKFFDLLSVCYCLHFTISYSLLLLRFFCSFTLKSQEIVIIVVSKSLLVHMVTAFEIPQASANRTKPSFHLETKKCSFHRHHIH